MRNLILQFSECNKTQLIKPRHLLLDANATKSKQTIYLATTDKLFAYVGKDKKLKELINLPGIVNAEFLALENQICLATEGGEVVVVNPATCEINEGTFCDVGIECMCWSPDQEVVVFVTKAHNVVVMTCTYDVIAEHSLNEQVDSQFVTVGWGKKETQFHGSEGKAAAKQTNEYQVPENISDLPQQVQITWRGDAAYFAVSFVSSSVGRMFKVFDKEGQLCFSSERLSNIQPALAWRPSGNWLAMPQCLPHKSIIVLFEKNGLKHRDITLPFNLNEEPVEKISWSNDSDILTLETFNAVSGEQRLYLYTIGNYHWYLKQVLTFNVNVDRLVSHVWDTRCGEEKTLHVLLESGTHLYYSWQLGINKASDSAVVAVIDGRKLLLTNFARNTVPPPMSQTEIVLPTDSSFINGCDFYHHKLLIHDAHLNLHIYYANACDPAQFNYELSLEPSDDILKFSPLSNVHWYDSNTIVAIDKDGRLLQLDIDELITKYTCTNCFTPRSRLRILSNVTSDKQFYAQNAEGNFHRLALNADEQIQELEEKCFSNLQQTVQKLLLLPQGDLIVLQTNQCLNVGNQQVATGVTSFGVVAEFLVYTQLTTLYFIRLHDRRFISERKIERGARLVAIMGEDGRIVLQMPRGNLEVITPRILALQHIGKLLDMKNYDAALTLSRKQRINLNILCDHNMCAFVDHLDVFLNDIKNSQWLNLFLSDLQNEDYSVTMYACNYETGNRTYPLDFELSKKILYLCERLCERMRKLDESRFQLSIITAYVKMAQVENALLLIWRQRKLEEQQQQGVVDDKKSLANEALRYLLYLVDVNELYNVALGTYDFGLVLFVAQHSQKDPREFLLILNELKSLETNYRYFRIDERLKRHERALQHIARCGKQHFEEALKFIQRHTLYRPALKCYAELDTEDSEELYKKVALAFGDHLRANGQLSNASLMYERGGNLAQSQLSARHVLDWQRVLLLARKQEQDIASVALSLVNALKEQSQFEVAYHLLRTYGDDFKVALKCLLRGKHYLKAVYETRLLKDDSNEDLIENVVKPDILGYYGVLSLILKADQDLFVTYKERLLVVREEKSNYKLKLQDDRTHQIDEIDLLSDTTSMHSSQYTSSSRGTGKTFRSSKNRRKHERKLLSLKPGNPFEDIALIDALYNHIMEIAATKQQQHIRDICQALLELRLDDEAEDIQQRFKGFMQLVQDSLHEIWIPELMCMPQLHLTGPNVDYTQLQNEQRFALIDPIKRLKPNLNFIEWEHPVLQN